MTTLDHAVLDQLRLDLEDDDGSAVAGLVDLYLASAQRLIPDVVAALQAGDTVAAGRFAHALASPSALIGAISMTSLLQGVQNAGHHPGGQPDDLATLAEAISSEADRVVAALGERPVPSARSLE